MHGWSRLSLYESTDLARDLFQQRHGRELGAEKAKEISSAIAQGREYFSAASDAGLLVRPLLQYYGVLSLSRGLVLLLSRNLRETSLPAAHGLSTDGWAAKLSPTNRTPHELQVRVNAGTFLSLLEHTGNGDLTTVYTGPYPNRIVFPRTRNVDALTGSIVTFEEVLARIPALRDMFERSFGKAAANYRAFVFTLSTTTLTDVDLFPGRHGLPPQDQLRHELNIPEDIPLQETAQHNFLPPELHLRYRLPHAPEPNFPQCLPQIDNGADGSMTIVSPFSAGFNLSGIGRVFLLSFFLGTLARYHPTTWLAIMQAPQKGDFLLPIIREAMRVVQEKFPLLAIAELEA